jgi:hypothetical protein
VPGPDGRERRTTRQINEGEAAAEPVGRQPSRSQRERDNLEFQLSDRARVMGPLFLHTEQRLNLYDDPVCETGVR